MELIDLLRIGSRKEIGEAEEVALILSNNPDKLNNYFDLLLKYKDESVIVSHGTYALKSASIINTEVEALAIHFFFKNSKHFTQWEAKENFLRILLISPKSHKLTKTEIDLIESFLNLKSSIIVTYAIDYLATYFFYKNDIRFKKYLEIGLADERAAVKARARKIIKRFKIKDLI